MPFHIRDPEADRLVRALARRRGLSLTDAVKEAAKEALDRDKSEPPIRDRLKNIAETLKAYPKTGQKADKAFFDDLSGG
jgi:antitoxin VapB